MNGKKTISKSMIAVVLAFLSVLLIVVAAWQCKPNEDRAEILLPDQPSDHGNTISEQTPDNSDTAEVERPNDQPLLQVTSENVASALRALERPSYYHQLYSVQVGSGESTVESTVELWVSAEAIHAQVVSAHHTKYILCGNDGIYIWYSSDEEPVHLENSQDISFEDILGLPAFDYIQTIEDAVVIDAEYLILEEDTSGTACIFLSLLDREGAQLRYWIDLETGLLYEADCMAGDEQIYLVKQEQFDRLVSGDETFSDKFMLPDGSTVLIDETQRQQ